MDHAQTGTGLHGHNTLDGHGHVNEGAVALFVPERLQAIGQGADLGIELLVGDMGDLAPIGLEDDGDLVAVAVVDVALKAVVGDVELPVIEPLVERRIGLVQGTGKRLVPGEFLASPLGPKSRVIVIGLFAQGLVGIHAVDSGLGRKVVRGFKNAVFVHDRFDAGGHGCLLLRDNRNLFWVCSFLYTFWAALPA